MKNKNKIIDTYFCDIYDVYLVVANESVTLEELQEKYVYSNKEELDKQIVDGLATTSVCYDKVDNTMVVLVKYNKESSHTNKKKNVDKINTYSHEATHVALDIYEMIGQNICYCTPEPFCYLQAWAMECIYKTLTK